MECVCVQRNTSDHHVNMVKQRERGREKTDFWFCLIENPCINQKNPCMNGGTCFGRYNLNGTLSTQCFCVQGYTGSYCEGS